MAKQIIWSKLAQKNRKSILQYWTERNKSNIYSLKLNQILVDTIELLSK
jgi:toxin YoeB